MAVVVDIIHASTAGQSRYWWLSLDASTIAMAATLSSAFICPLTGRVSFSGNHHNVLCLSSVHTVHGCPLLGVTLW